MSVAAVIVAAGRGVRFGPDAPKQFGLLGNKPVLFHSIELFERLAEFDRIWLVLPADYAEVWQERFDCSVYSKVVGWCAGGTRRQDSVWAALKSLPADTEIVAIHDAVRPLAWPAAVSEAVARAGQMGAAILAVPVLDTVKQCQADGRIVQTLERDHVWLAQTPQVFRFDLIRRAYERVMAEGVEITDEAAAVERLGEPVEVVACLRPNPKITTPADLRYAEWLLREEGRL